MEARKYIESKKMLSYSCIVRSIPFDLKRGKDWGTTNEQRHEYFKEKFCYNQNL